MAGDPHNDGVVIRQKHGHPVHGVPAWNTSGSRPTRRSLPGYSHGACPRIRDRQHVWERFAGANDEVRPLSPFRTDSM
jgi:hypothetical protein